MPPLAGAGAGLPALLLEMLPFMMMSVMNKQLTGYISTVYMNNSNLETSTYLESYTSMSDRDVEVSCLTAKKEGGLIARDQKREVGADKKMSLWTATTTRGQQMLQECKAVF